MKMKNYLNRSLAMLGLLLLCAVAFAQESRTVKGKVTDAKGEPIPGVNVLIQGTTNGTITDIDGNYVLEVPNAQTAVLQFTFIGYQNLTIPVGGQSTINAALKDDSIGLEEVVAIGYGVVKKSDLTGSIGSVTGTALAAKGTTSAMGALQGTVAGVNITTNSARAGGGFSIQIRGQNSLQEGNPLYVVDGVVTDNIDFLNPADIERIDILKDASSTAIYGSRASNGVVIVQTKNAGVVKKGEATVTYDGYYGIRQVARMPDFMTGREWIDWRTSAFYSYNAGTRAYSMTTANQNVVLQNSPLLKQRLVDGDDTDWADLVTQNGKQQNHFLSVTGSTNDLSYVIGLGYQNEDGNFINESLDRYNFKLSVNHKSSKYFTAGANMSLSMSELNLGSEYGYREAFRQAPIIKAYDDNGELIPQPAIASAIQGAGNLTSSPNPLIELNAGNQENRRFDIIGNVYAAITPVAWLEFKSTLSPRLTRKRDAKYFGVVPGNRTTSLATQDNREYFDWTMDNQVTFNRQFGDHQLNATFINSIYSTRYEQVGLGSENLPYDSQWYNLASGTLRTGDSGSAYSETSMLSYSGRVNYNYLGRYMVTATVRYDGSSKLADKWESFPSMALAWRISEEEFLALDWLTNLKLRASLGYSGNNNGVNAYGTQVTPNYSSFVYYDYNGNVVSGFPPGTPVNKGLTWEKTREVNLGLDFGILNGRVSGSFDWYDKLSDGLLMKRKLAIESGVVEMTDNIGSVSNKGIEIALSTVNVKRKDLEWTTSFTFSRNKNAIESLYGKKEDVIGEARFIGKPINVIYDYVFDGVWTPDDLAQMSEAEIAAYQAGPGRARVVDHGDKGYITPDDDKKILGSPDPDWIGSFSSMLYYKNFDFSFNIYTRQGVFVDSPFLDEFGYKNERGRSKIKMDYYVPAGLPRLDQNFDWGTSTANYSQAHPAPYNAGPYYGGNARYTDASFVKVKNITLGYTLPSTLTKKAYIKSMRVYANVLNPFTLTDYVGFDPEYAHVAINSGNGPSNVTYQFGVNVKF